jgi:transposase
MGFVMSAAVKLIRPDHSADAFRREAACCSDADAARRMLALALVREGVARAEAARVFGMDRQTLRDWVHRYNEAGLAGLSDKSGRRGPKPRLTAEQAQEVAGLVRKGPDLAEHGVVRWRRIDLAAAIQAKFGVTLAERTVGTILRGLGFRRISVRPQHPEQDAAAQEAHKKTSPIWWPGSFPNRRAANRSSSGFRCYEGGHWPG